MKLQILIPQYKETDAIIQPLLDSIAIQQNVDWSEVEVIVLNDGSDVILSDSVTKVYPFPLSYLVDGHKGVSGTRNSLLKMASADYIMYCDADDMFLSVLGLYTIFSFIDEGFDVLVSDFIEEARDPSTGKPVHIFRENDGTFIHGKVYRRQYLLDNDIKWANHLTVHEDGYFNILCRSLPHKEVRYDKPFYLWKWRDDSICRQSENFVMRTYDKLLDANSALLDAFVMRGMDDEAKMYCAMMVYNTYFTVNKQEWSLPENATWLVNAEISFADYFRRYRYLFASTPDEVKAKIVKKVRDNKVKEGLLLERITFEDWIGKFNG